ncbi:hypothetical protein [Rhizohabitans arisaemae]|nr:hypothetical protein [Rhizohabitans arisaemae]
MKTAFSGLNLGISDSRIDGSKLPVRDRRSAWKQRRWESET